MLRTAAQLGAAAGFVVAVGISLAFATGAGDGPAVDSQTALNEGNRHFRDGRLDQAVTAYEAGYSAKSPHPTLLYNLGTTLHHLDRLPEAILWYRRAAASDDPWLAENLWLARRSLGSQILPAGGSVGWLGRHTGALRLVAIAIAWLILLLVLSSPKMPGWALITVSLLTVTLYGSAAAIDRWGPRPAVILSDCFTSAGDLPAGTEAWVSRGADGRWTISGSENVVCPAETIELIFPDS